jgi:hypothetical protein
LISVKSNNAPVVSSTRDSWSLLAHALLILLLTVKILILVLVDARYLTVTEDSFRYIFSVNPAYSFSTKNVLFTVQDVILHLNGTMNAYYNLGNTSIDRILYQDANGYCSGVPDPAQQAVLTYLNENSVAVHKMPIAAFSNYIQNWTSTHFPSQLQTVRFMFPVCGHRYIGRHTDCFEWNINIAYSYISQLVVIVSIDSSLVSTCRGTRSLSQSVLKWFEMILLLISIPYLAKVTAVSRSVALGIGTLPNIGFSC